MCANLCGNFKSPTRYCLSSSSKCTSNSSLLISSIPFLSESVIIDNTITPFKQKNKKPPNTYSRRWFNLSNSYLDLSVNVSIFVKLNLVNRFTITEAEQLDRHCNT